MLKVTTSKPKKTKMKEKRMVKMKSIVKMKIMKLLQQDSQGMVKVTS